MEEGAASREEGAKDTDPRSWDNYAWRMRVKMTLCVALTLAIVLILGILLIVGAEQLNASPGSGDINKECTAPDGKKYPETDKRCHEDYSTLQSVGAVLAGCSGLALVVLALRRQVLGLKFTLFMSSALCWTHEDWCFGHRVTGYDLVMTKS